MAAFILGLLSQGPVYEQYNGNIKKLDGVDYCIVLRTSYFPHYLWKNSPFF